MDELDPLKQKYKQKFPEFNEQQLAKNKLLLEHTILNRNIKREIRLQQQAHIKQQANQVYHPR